MKKILTQEEKEAKIAAKIAARKLYLAEYQRKWNDANREKRREYNRNVDKEKTRTYNKKYYQNRKTKKERQFMQEVVNELSTPSLIERIIAISAAMFYIGGSLLIITYLINQILN